MPKLTVREQLAANRDAVLDELHRALERGSSKQVIGSFVQILRQSSGRYSWVGVYLLRESTLVLEAYAGEAETGHVSIPMGEGICGFAAKTGETVVVPDVSKDPRYLMCFPSTRSEIVVPIKGRHGVIGEIDIDSNVLGAFTASDQEFLEQAAGDLASYLEKHAREG